MTNEFSNKPTKIQPAIVGTIANPDDYNNNIAGQSKGSIVPIDENGNYKDGDLGNEAIVANGALINNIKMRQGGFIKIYDSAGNFLNNVSFGDATTLIKGFSLINNPIILSNNTLDANNDIDFASGNFSFFDGSGQNTFSALTKRLDASWVAGNNNGGLFSGTKANSTWYHCFIIYNPTSGVVDCGFDTSLIAANRPSGYTKYKKVHSILTDGSGNIRGFLMLSPNLIRWKNPTLDISTVTLSTSRSSYTIPTPLGVRSLAIMNTFFTASVDVKGIISNLDSVDNAPSSSSSSLLNMLVNGYGGAGQVLEITNTSSQIGARSTSVSTTFNASVIMYIDLSL